MYVGISKVTRAGQITLPIDLRRKMGIDEGSDVMLVGDGKTVRIVTNDSLEEVFRLFEASAKAEGLTKEQVERELKAARKETMKKYR
ncbi:MAG: AbrB/MazE/SpoVT family DNA-binding domain-containing protein [Candidatus Micrarchaeia archaeon]|jgi:AbrB family looped-hinge helix DNA binding protein